MIQIPFFLLFSYEIVDVLRTPNPKN